MPLNNPVTREVNKDVAVDGDYYSEVVSVGSQETVEYAIEADDSVIVEIEWLSEDGSFEVVEEVVSSTDKKLNNTGVKCDRARIRVTDDSAASNNVAQGFIRFN